MSRLHGVVWSQGLFLQPQHFQQQARHGEAVLDARLQAVGPYAWGYTQLVLDESQLALGRVALLRASGVLPDGTPFSMPDQDALPAPLDVPADLTSERICLAVPLARSGVTDIDYGDGAADAGSRYTVQEVLLRDQANASDDPEPVQLAAPRLCLLRQRDVGDAHAALGVVRVLERRADGQLVLDRGYLAPQTRLDASGQLSALATLLHGLVQQRAATLAGLMGQLGHGVSEVADFLMLQLLNRHEPLLRQAAATPSLHPWLLHQQLLALAGELCTFDTDGGRLPPVWPPYRHDDLQGCHGPLVERLRELLSAVIARQSEPVALVARSHGVHTAVVADGELLRTAGFVLAVRAQLPAELLRQQFPLKAKLAPTERLKELVNLNLPAVALRWLPVAPRQLPFHANSHYFELDRQGDLWKQIERSGHLALHVSDQFPGLELELWAIRQPG